MPMDEAARQLLAGWGVRDSRDIGRIVLALWRVRMVRLPHAAASADAFASLLFFDDVADGGSREQPRE